MIKGRQAVPCEPAAHSSLVLLKKYACVTTLLKSLDTDIKKKASVFTKEELDKFIGAKELGISYWIVGKAIVLCAFFGGLWHAELMNLKLERVVSTKNGVSVNHNRAKQRSDKLEAKFLTPRVSKLGQLDHRGLTKGVRGWDLFIRPF